MPSLNYLTQYGQQDINKMTGLLEPGNIDPYNRPVIMNPDGTHSTTRSFSIGEPRGEVLIPKIVNGKELSQKDAIAHYKQSGEHLGVFDTPETADAYAEWLHNEQEKYVQDQNLLRAYQNAQP